MPSVNTMRRVVAFLFHAPGLRLVYAERLSPQLARANTLAVAATVGLMLIGWTTAPADQQVLHATIAFIAGHVTWGGYLAWQLPAAPTDS